VHHAQVPFSSSSLHSASRRVNFLSQRPFLDFIALYPHRSCSDANEEHIFVIGVSPSIYTCNSIVADALLVTLQHRLGNFPVFFSFFLSLVCSPHHPSCIDRSE
jgi:hypothetical protein